MLVCVGPLVRDMVQCGLLHEFEPLAKGKKKKKTIQCDLEVLHVTLNFKIISLGDKYWLDCIGLHFHRMSPKGLQHFKLSWIKCYSVVYLPFFFFWKLTWNLSFFFESYNGIQSFNVSNNCWKLIFFVVLTRRSQMLRWSHQCWVCRAIGMLHMQMSWQISMSMVTRVKFGTY